MADANGILYLIFVSITPVTEHSEDLDRHELDFFSMACGDSAAVMIFTSQIKPQI